MQQEQLRELAKRARTLVAEAKAAYWQAARAADPLATMTAAHAAFEQARAVEFPSPEYLEADFAHHLTSQTID